MSRKSTDPEIAAAVAEISSRDWTRQHAGIQTLAGIPSTESDLALLRLLDHRSSNVREAAMTALLERDIAVARLAARAGLSDGNSCVRTRAAEALGWLGTRLDSRRLTIALSDDKDWVVRASAADSLGQVAKKAARPALIRAMRDDPHPVVRRDAAFALSYANDPGVIPELESALSGEIEEQAQLGLLHCLYVLGQRERLTEFLSHLRSLDSQVRQATINALEGDIRPEDREVVIEALRSMADTETNPGVRGDALRVVEVLRVVRGASSPSHVPGPSPHAHRRGPIVAGPSPHAHRRTPIVPRP